MSQHKLHKIVILGSGFGGIHSFLSLQKQLRHRRDVEIMLLSKTPTFLFTPFLHEVATGSISADKIQEPLNRLVHHPQAKVVRGEVKAISWEQKKVFIYEGEIPFDFLVIALGSTNNFYHIPGAKDSCYTLKTIDDALKLKNHLLEITNEPHHQKRTVAIIGAGATGVELAVEITRHFRKRISLLLIEQAATLLPGFSPNIQTNILAFLKRNNIEVWCKSGVKKITPDFIETQKGKIATDTAIWTAGIQPVPITSDSGSQNEKGYFLVDSTLQIIGEKKSFALGDISLCQDPTTGRPVPALAQSALQQAKIVAKNIVRMLEQKPLLSFHYRSHGQFISLGEQAVGEISRFSFRGRLGGFLWHIIHIAKLLSWKKRILVTFNWIFRF